MTGSSPNPPLEAALNGGDLDLDDSDAVFADAGADLVNVDDMTAVDAL